MSDVTFTGHSLEQRIESLLRNNPDDEFTPKQIAVALKASKSSVRVSLRRLVEKNKIVSTLHGRNIFP